MKQERGRGGRREGDEEVKDEEEMNKEKKQGMKNEKRNQGMMQM